MTSSPRVRAYFFQSKNVFVEVMLKLFIGQIDAHLFKAVIFKILETENVQNPNFQNIFNLTKELNTDFII